MVLVASETGHVYTFSTEKFQPILNSKPGRKLIQTCLSDEGDVADLDLENVMEGSDLKPDETSSTDSSVEIGAPYDTPVHIERHHSERFLTLKNLTKYKWI